MFVNFTRFVFIFDSDSTTEFSHGFPYYGRRNTGMDRERQFDGAEHNECSFEISRYVAWTRFNGNLIFDQWTCVQTQLRRYPISIYIPVQYIRFLYGHVKGINPNELKNNSIFHEDRSVTQCETCTRFWIRGHVNNRKYRTRVNDKFSV